MPARLPTVLVLSLVLQVDVLARPGAEIPNRPPRSPAKAYADARGDARLYLPIANPFPRGVGSLAPEGRHEETSWPIILGGTWERVGDARASGGAYLVSREPGASAEIPFGGDSIVLLRLVDETGGRAEVSVDGVPLGELGFGFVEPRWQVPAVFDGLGEGPHRLVLRALSDQPVYLDAFVLPSPFEPSAEQRAVLDRLNAYRSGAGLMPARLVGAVNLGAQAHADYDALHHESHRESPGRPGYTGATPRARVSLFGVDRNCGEVMAGVGGPAAVVDFGPERVLDFWLQSVFHRSTLLRYGRPAVGYGHARRGEDAVVEVGVLDLCEYQDPAPAERLIYTFPADGQTEVPLDFSSDTETPDPLPEHSGETGYPISLYIAQPAEPNGRAEGRMTVSTAELRDAGGRLLPAFRVDASDPNGLITPDEFFLIPQVPLRMSRRYEARVAGRDSRGLDFDHAWSFTTRMATRIEEVTVDAGGCGAELRWRTAGPTRAWLEYGPTDAYGTRLDDPQVEPARVHSVRLGPLRLGTRYHYRIWVEDALGLRADSGDATFTTTPGPMGQQVEVYPGACHAQLHWATVCETRSWLEFGTSSDFGRRTEATELGLAHVAWLSDLVPETTYHYRISALDPSGEIFVSPAATLTTPPPRTLRVPEDYPNERRALMWAGPCDTVQLAPGSYDNVSIRIPPRVRLLGAGADRTFLHGDTFGTVVYLADGAELRGFTVAGSGMVGANDVGITAAPGASPIIRNNRVQGNREGIRLHCEGANCGNGSSPLIANNVILNNRDCGVCWVGSAPRIVNNTIVANGAGISGYTPTVVMNNIVSGNLSAGIAGTVVPEVFHHNNVWGNAVNYSSGAAAPGPGSLSVDPGFVAPESGDYHLRADSLCRGAGDPDPAQSNPDGSQGDMGAYGGPWAEE